MSWRMRLLGPQRSRRQIEAEIDEELRSHIAFARRDLQSAGRTPQEVETIAAERLGDVAAIRRACIGIALEEQIMIQRINLALIVIVGLVLGWGTYSTHIMQKRQAEAISAIAAHLESVSLVGRIPAGVVPITSAPGGNVYLGGMVARPGAFHCPANGFTLRRLMFAAGPVGDDAQRITVRGADGQVRGELTAAELGNEAGKDLELRPEDIVTVH